MVSANQFKCEHLEQFPSYDELLEQYLTPNIPVIIGSAVIKHWPVVEHWRKITKIRKSSTISGETSSDIDWGYLSVSFSLRSEHPSSTNGMAEEYHMTSGKRLIRTTLNYTKRRR